MGAGGAGGRHLDEARGEGRRLGAELRHGGGLVQGPAQEGAQGEQACAGPSRRVQQRAVRTRVEAEPEGSGRAVPALTRFATKGSVVTSEPGPVALTSQPTSRSVMVPSRSARTRRPSAPGSAATRLPRSSRNRPSARRSAMACAEAGGMRCRWISQ
ncbi:hypothetical protein ACFQYP_41215 [Nonomuraea antimicrobica]